MYYNNKKEDIIFKYIIDNRNKNYKIFSKKWIRYMFNLDVENCDILLKDIK